MPRAMIVFILTAFACACSPPAPTGSEHAAAPQTSAAQASSPSGAAAIPASAAGADASPTASGGPPSNAGGGSVASLVAQKPTTGTFTVVGYVNYIYRCPACPAGANCKPCMGDNFIVSDAPKTIANYQDVAASDLIVLADRPLLDGLSVGKHYKLEIQITNHKQMSQPVNDPQLVKASALP